MKNNLKYIIILALLLMKKNAECLASLGNGSIKGRISVKEWLRANCQPDICSCLPCGDNDYSTFKKTTDQVAVGKMKPTEPVIVKNSNDKLRYFFSELQKTFQDKLQNNKREKIDDLLRYLYKIYLTIKLNSQSKFLINQRGRKMKSIKERYENKPTEILQIKND